MSAILKNRFYRWLGAALAIVLVAQETSAQSQWPCLAPRSSFPQKSEFQPIVSQYEYADSAALAAADLLIERIRDSSKQKKQLRVGLSALRATRFFLRELYDRLEEETAKEGEEKIDLSHVVFFMLDEYDLPPSYRRSFRYLLDAALFKPFGIPAGNIHGLSAYDGLGDRLDDSMVEENLREYEAKIEGMGGLDIAICGMGKDGHIMFNYQGDPAAYHAREVVLSPSIKEAKRIDFDGDADRVPDKAFSVGVNAVLKAQETWFLGFGEESRKAVSDAIAGTGSFVSEFPNHNVHIFCDHAAHPSQVSAWERIKGNIWQGFLRLGFRGMHEVNNIYLTAAWAVLILFPLIFAISAYAYYVLGLSYGMYGFVVSLDYLVFLIMYNRYLYLNNPYRNLVDGGNPNMEDGKVEYRIEKIEPDGPVLREARPIKPNHPEQLPGIHVTGREFEFFIGLRTKFNNFLDIYSRNAYDIVSLWGSTRRPGVAFLRSWIGAWYLPQGETQQDLPELVSFDYAEVEKWPFYYLRTFGELRKILARVVAHFHAGLFLGGPSAGGRIALEEASDAALEPPEKEGLQSNKLRKVPTANISGVWAINAFFHPVKRPGSEWMRGQNALFWRRMAHYKDVGISAYDEMDRSNDLTPLQENIRLASNHKDSPQKFLLYTRMIHPGLKPPAWGEVKKRLSKAGISFSHFISGWLCVGTGLTVLGQLYGILGSLQGLAAFLAVVASLKTLLEWRQIAAPVAPSLKKVFSPAGYLYGKTLIQVSGEIAKQFVTRIWAGLRRKADLPLYYWWASMHVNFRGTDGAVDPRLAMGLDYFGQPLDPETCLTILEGDGMHHDAIENPKVQRLIAHVGGLYSKRKDLHQVALVASRGVKGPDGNVRFEEVQRIKLEDHDPLHPVVLNVNGIDRLELVELVPLENAEKHAREKLRLETLVRQNPLSFRGWETGAQAEKSLEVLELRKAHVAQKAWEMATEVEYSFQPSPTDVAQQARRDIRRLLAKSWVIATMLMQVWEAKGLLASGPAPVQEDAVFWDETLPFVRNRIRHRSKSRWMDRKFTLGELVDYQLADQQFHKGWHELSKRVQRPVEFKKILEDLLADEGQDWVDASRKYAEWIQSRTGDFIQWTTAWEKAWDYVHAYLKIDSDTALSARWADHKGGKESPGELFQFLLEKRSGQMLRLLLSLDLGFRLGAPGEEAREDVLDPSLPAVLDSAA